MLGTPKDVLFRGHNHLLTTGADDPTLWLSPERQWEKGHQYQWLAGGYGLEIWHFTGAQHGGYLVDSGFFAWCTLVWLVRLVWHVLREFFCRSIAASLINLHTKAAIVLSIEVKRFLRAIYHTMTHNLYISVMTMGHHYFRQGDISGILLLVFLSVCLLATLLKTL